MSIEAEPVFLRNRPIQSLVMTGYIWESWLFSSEGSWGPKDSGDYFSQWRMECPHRREVMVYCRIVMMESLVDRIRTRAPN